MLYLNFENHQIYGYVFKMIYLHTLLSIISYIFTNKLISLDIFTQRTKPFISIYSSFNIAVVYMSCFEKKPFNATKFGLPTYRLTCKSKGDDYCFEAVPYLQFFYDHYYDEHRKFFFVHAHEFSFHYNKSIFRVVKDRIISPEFQKDLYGPLYVKIWGTKVKWKSGPYRSLFKEIYHNTTMMEYYNINSTTFPCCGTFFVDSSLFRSRPRDEYLTYIERLQSFSRRHPEKKYSLFCGRLTEYTWHLMLGTSKYQYITKDGAV